MEIVGRIFGLVLVGCSTFGFLYFFDWYQLPIEYDVGLSAVAGVIGFIFGPKAIEAVFSIF